jgi:hypothetical protein
MRAKSRTAARTASRQKGVITRQQLLDAEWSSSAITRWIDKELLIAEHPGV